MKKIFSDQSSWVFKDHVRVVYIEHTQYLSIFKGVEFPDFSWQLEKLWQFEFLYMLEDHYQLTELGQKIAKTHLFFLDKTKTD